MTDDQAPITKARKGHECERDFWSQTRLGPPRVYHDRQAPEIADNMVEVFSMGPSPDNCHPWQVAMYNVLQLAAEARAERGRPLHDLLDGIEHNAVSVLYHPFGRTVE